MTEKGPITEELLARLLASSSPEAYLDQEQDNLETRGFSEYVVTLLGEHGLTRREVIDASGLNITYCYQIFQGTRVPGRNHALMLAFGLGASVLETQRLLRLAGLSELWSRRRRDAIIIFCLEHGMTRQQCDDELFRLGEETLLSEGA